MQSTEPQGSRYWGGGLLEMLDRVPIVHIEVPQ